jgi:hypothetical protein
MIKIISSIIIAMLCTIELYSQTKNKIDLDSLFEVYLKQKNIKSENFISYTESIEEKAGKCGFSTRANVTLNLKNFSPYKKRILNTLNSRPYLKNSLISPYGHFKIHYNSTGDSIPKYDGRTNINEIINDVANILDSIYNFEIKFLGYPEPPKDNGAGGDDLYDIYILPQTEYGGTTPESPIGKDLYTSYIEVDNAYSGRKYYTNGINALKVTLAHEFFHAIQMGSYGLKGDINIEDLYFYEMSSTAMEEFVYDDVNDYYNYLYNYFNNSQKSFSQFSGMEMYALGIWNIFLKENLGATAFNIIKRQWELFIQNRALTAINFSFAEYQTSFKDQLNTFGIWCYFTGYRKTIDKYFKEGKYYPIIKPTFKMDFTPPETEWTLSVKPLSNSYIRLLADNGTYIDTIYSIVTNGDYAAGLNFPGSDFQCEFGIYNNPVEGSIKIANSYYSKLTSSNIQDYSESDIFNNVLADGRETIFKETDQAFPNPFRYKANSSLYLPVKYNKDKTVKIYIYSINMNLLYNGFGNIITLFDKFVVPWIGLDNDNKKLPTGVYMFITDSEDKIKKGKVVIFNE